MKNYKHFVIIGTIRQRWNGSDKMGRLSERRPLETWKRHGIQPLHPVLQHKHEPLGGPVHLQASEILGQPLRQPGSRPSIPVHLARIPQRLLRLFPLRIPRHETVCVLKSCLCKCPWNFGFLSIHKLTRYCKVEKHNIHYASTQFFFEPFTRPQNKSTLSENNHSVSKKNT